MLQPTVLVWFLVFKVLALTHQVSEINQAEFENKQQCLDAVVALQAGRPLVPYAGWGAGHEQPENDFLFCTDRVESGG